MKKAIIVLGMHRSGTSSMAGTLVALGATAPKTLMPVHPQDNPKGYYESLTLMKLNDRLLAAAGSSWKDRRAFPVAWAGTVEGQVYIKELSNVVRSEFEDAPLIVLKDPRICRLFPLWKVALNQAGYQPQIMIPMRHPLEVAASLSKRERFTQSQGLLLWLRHVLDAERDTRSEDRIIVLWEDFIQDWQQTVEQVCDRFDLDLWPATPERFDLANTTIDPSLRRNMALDIKAGPAFDLVRSVYETMKALALQPYDRQHLNSLDAAGREFEIGLRYAGPLEDDVCLEVETHAKLERQKYEACKAELVAEKSRVKRRDTALQEMFTQLNHYKAKAASAILALDDLTSAKDILSERLLSALKAMEIQPTDCHQGLEQTGLLPQTIEDLPHVITEDTNLNKS